jgi:hypothetical protein
MTDQTDEEHDQTDEEQRDEYKNNGKRRNYNNGESDRHWALAEGVIAVAERPRRDRAHHPESEACQESGEHDALPDSNHPVIAVACPFPPGHQNNKTADDEDQQNDRT